MARQMSHALTLDSRDLALELHALLREIDPVHWRSDLEAAIRLRMASLERRLTELLQSSWPEDLRTSLCDRLGELSRLLREEAPALDHPGRDLREEWKAFRQRLQHSYDELAVSLRRFDIHVPSLRPTNYRRSLFHVSAAAVAVLMVEVVLSPPLLIAAAGAFALYAWSMEAGRRLSPELNLRLMAFYGKMAHPHEWHRVNSSTWFITALLLLSLTGTALVCTVALAVLGLADPAAGLVGRRWGCIRLLNGRSLEGTLTFVAVGTLTALGCLALWHPEAPWPHSLAIAAGGAVPGALAELVARRIDDNLAIPVCAAGGAWFTAASLGIPLV
jgi:dolichol kinase